MSPRWSHRGRTGAGLVRRPISSTALCLVVTLAVGLGWESAAWSATALTNGHGLSTCAVSGSVTFTPPQTAGASGTSTLSAALTLASCVGNDFVQAGRTVTGGSATSLGTPKVPSACPSPTVAPGSNSVVSSFPKLRFKVTWTTSSGAPASKMTLLNGLSTFTGANGPSLLPTATQTLTYSAATKATGAFHLPTKNLQAVSLSVAVDQDFDAQVTSTSTGCASSAGLAKITFSGTLRLP